MAENTKGDKTAQALAQGAQAGLRAVLDAGLVRELKRFAGVFLEALAGSLKGTGDPKLWGMGMLAATTATRLQRAYRAELDAIVRRVTSVPEPDAPADVEPVETSGPGDAWLDG
jgi:hypothetical protein